MQEKGQYGRIADFDFSPPPDLHSIDENEHIIKSS